MLIERFTSKYKVNHSTGCWEWTASLTTVGYAKFFADGRLNTAHRYSYENVVGPIPEGLQLDHLCRVRHCVNPAHLEPVTQRENLLRGKTLAAANAAKTNCPQGHPYYGENLYTDPRLGSRHCRKCMRDSCRRQMDRAKRRQS